MPNEKTRGMTETRYEALLRLATWYERFGHPSCADTLREEAARELRREFYE